MKKIDHNTSPQVLGIIPARGGSKGIPKKNIAPLAGKPLIYYTIREAAKSKLLNAFIVSTDSEEIAEVARSFGADVPFLRPAEFAKDFTPDLPVFQHALEWLKENRGWEPDIVINLRPTSPLRLASDIDYVIRLMRETECDSIRTVSRPDNNPFKMWYVDESDFSIQPLLPTAYFDTLGTDVPRQLLPQNVYCQNGMVDATRAKWILQGKIYGPNIRGVIIESERAVDIDRPEDLETAALLMKKLSLSM